MFNFVRDCQTVFQGSCTILLSYKQFRRVSFFSISLPILSFISPFSLWLSYWLWSSILLWFWFAFKMMTSDVEHIFMCFLGICISEEMFIQILYWFLNCLLLLNHKGSLYILHTRPLHMILDISRRSYFTKWDHTVIIVVLWPVLLLIVFFFCA